MLLGVLLGGSGTSEVDVFVMLAAECSARSHSRPHLKACGSNMVRAVECLANKELVMWWFRIRGGKDVVDLRVKIL